MTAPKLTLDSAGRVHGANITWNSPWPCANGNDGGMSVPHGVMGLLEHTMVGNLLPGTVSWFNNPAAQASAHFGVDQLGNIHQFGPVNGWMAWHCAAGNPNWYGCEMADDGVPANPLTPAQVTAAAQLLELLSRPDVGNFPLQISDSTSTEGYGWHGMGGVAFGDHPDCPGDVRKAQRPQIIALAMSIRQGVPVPPASFIQHVTAGESSLAQLAAQNGCEVSAILRLTAEHSPDSVYPPNVASLINGVFACTVSPGAPMPPGLVLYLPA